MVAYVGGEGAGSFPENREKGFQQSRTYTGYLQRSPHLIPRIISVKESRRCGTSSGKAGRRMPSPFPHAFCTDVVSKVSVTLLSQGPAFEDVCYE